MSILDIFRKKDDAQPGKQSPYLIHTELTPYRLSAYRSSSAVLTVRIKNVAKEPLLTSFWMELPQGISLDELGMSKSKEYQLGEMKPAEQKELRIGVYSSMKTEKGDYTMRMMATAHFRDYNHVVNEVRFTRGINVV